MEKLFFFSERIVAQGLLCDCQAKTKSTAVRAAEKELFENALKSC